MIITKELREFHSKHKEPIHKILNEMWKTTEKMATQLESLIPDLDLQNSHGNYIKIRKGWDEATYANPSIGFSFGEIGYSLDGPFCTFSLDASKIKEKFFAKLYPLTKENPDITFELYGGDDFFQTFYVSTEERDLDEILTNIAQTKEQIVQLELSIKFLPEFETLEAFLETTKELYQYLKKNALCKELPSSEK